MFTDKVVMITGASSGIGAELARLFAHDGAHLILIARREDRLRALAEEIRSAADHPSELGHRKRHLPSEPGRPRPGRQVEVIPADLVEPGACERVIARTVAKAGPVDVLVNNAGVGEYGHFADQDPSALERMMQLNTAALVRLTRLVLPEMLSRRRGWILNVASVAGFQPTPYMAVYGATKAFVLNFSMSLWEEVRRKGLVVTCVCPGPVKTEFFDRGGFETRKNEFNRVAVPADRVARAAYQALAKRRPVRVPEWTSRLRLGLQRLIPTPTVTKLAGRILRPR